MSIYELACLYIGVNPGFKDSPNNATTFPRIPSEGSDDLDLEEIQRDFESIRFLLGRAVEEKAINQTVTGKIKPIDAVTYLDGVSGNSNQAWNAECEFANFVRSSRLKANKRISDLPTYTTPMLKLVFEVITDLYEGKKDSYPKRFTVLQYMKDKGNKLSDKKMDAIWAVVSHPSQGRGGRTKR